MPRRSKDRDLPAARGRRRGAPAGEAVVVAERVDERAIERAVRALNTIHRTKGLEMALEVGRYVLKTFFGGSEERFLATGHRSATFGRLASHPDLHLTSSTLWYSVRLVGQYRLLPKRVFEALPLSHHRLLTHVQDAERKRELAIRAVDEGLTKRQLEALIAGEKAPPVRGRKPMPAFQKELGRLQRLFESESDPFGDLDAAASLDPRVAKELRETTRRVIARCERVLTALESVRPR